MTNDDGADLFTNFMGRWEHAVRHEGLTLFEGLSGPGPATALSLSLSYSDAPGETTHELTLVPEIRDGRAVIVVRTTRSQKA